MSPESQAAQNARFQQRLDDLAEVVGRFGQMLVDQGVMAERLAGLMARVKELEDDAEMDRRERAKDREDRRKFALTFAVSVVGLVITLTGLIFVILQFSAR